MFFDPDATAAERRVTLGLAPPPDEIFAKEWDNLGVVSQLVCFEAPYTASAHPDAAFRRELNSRSSAKPFSIATLLERKAQKKAQIDRERAIKNGESVKDAPPVVLDTVLTGPEFLYREPRVQQKPQHVAKQCVAVAQPAVLSRCRGMLTAGASVHFVDDDRARATRECRRVLSEAIAAQSCGGASDSQSRSLLYDADFLVGSRDAHYPAGTDPHARVQEPHDVARLSRLYPDALVVDPDSSSYAIVSTTNDSYALVTALEWLRQTEAGRHQLFDVLVAAEGMSVQDCLLRHGVLGVLLFVDGRWDFVVVDDFVAVDAARQPMYLQQVDWEDAIQLERRFGSPHTAADERVPIPWKSPELHEMWPHLLLKAAAKRLGCYNALSMLSFSDAITLLTGMLEMPTQAIDADAAADILEALREASNDSDVLSVPSYALVYPRAATRAANTRSQAAVTYASSLPCWVLAVSDGASGTLVADVYSPFGTFCRRPAPPARDAAEVSQCMRLDVAEFAALFAYVERFELRDAAHPMVELHSVSDPTVPHAYSLSIATALRTDVVLSVEQAMPLAELTLPYQSRRVLPYVCVQWTVLSADRSVVEYRTPPEVRRQVARHVDLEPGEHILEVAFALGPSVPYRISISAPATAAVTLCHYGIDPSVHGVSTKEIQQAAPPSTAELQRRRSNAQQMLGDVMTRRASRWLKPSVPAEAASAFQQADILRRGQLSADGCQRALLHWLLECTPGGQTFRRGLEQASATMDAVAFHELLLKSQEAGFHSPNL